MIEARTVRLGNPSPRQRCPYPAPNGLDLAGLRAFATIDRRLNISHLAGRADECDLIRQHCADVPGDKPWTGGEVVTEIRVSPDSSADEAIKEILTCWVEAATGRPSWIESSDPGLLAALQSFFGGE